MLPKTHILYILPNCHPQEMSLLLHLAFLMLTGDYSSSRNHILMTMSSRKTGATFSLFGVFHYISKKKKFPKVPSKFSFKSQKKKEKKKKVDICLYSHHPFESKNGPGSLA